MIVQKSDINSNTNPMLTPSDVQNYVTRAKAFPPSQKPSW